MWEELLPQLRHALWKTREAAAARRYILGRLSALTARAFAFGFLPPSFSGLTGFDAVEAGLAYRDASGALCNRFASHPLVLPLFDGDGRCVGILGRALDDSVKPKYLYSRGTPRSLLVFGLDKAKASIISTNRVICVEGQIDCIACHQAGVSNVVALGSAYLSPAQFFKLRRYTNNLMLLLDEDSAGVKGRRQMHQRFGGSCTISDLAVPGGFKHIDESLCSHPDPKKVVSWLRRISGGSDAEEEEPFRPIPTNVQ